MERRRGRRRSCCFFDSGRVECETVSNALFPRFKRLSLSPFSHLAASPARHRDDESREPPLSACAGEEEAQPMLARFRKKTRRNKGNKIESEEKRPYVKTRFFTSRKRRGTLSLSFVSRSPSSFPCLSKMTDADMVEAPASTADAAAAAADASAAAAAKALAKGKAPVTANALSADALARAAATAASAPWVEKYRPNTLDDVASHGEIIETSEWRYRWKRRGKEKKRRRLMIGIRTEQTINRAGRLKTSRNLDLDLFREKKPIQLDQSAALSPRTASRTSSSTVPRERERLPPSWLSPARSTGPRPCPRWSSSSTPRTTAGSASSGSRSSTSPRRARSSPINSSS